MVVVIDRATMDGTRANPPLSSAHIVTASSAQEAEDKAVAEDNGLNGYGSDEDGGFIAVHAYTREDLQWFLEQMADAE